MLARPNLKVVSEFSYCVSGFVTTQDPAGHNESERTSLVEQHRPIDENLDPFAHWKKLIGLQKHANTASRCLAIGFRATKCRGPVMVPLVPLSQITLSRSR
jgi:hypothetical protein